MKVTFHKDGRVSVAGKPVGTWRRKRNWHFEFKPDDNHPDNGAGRTSVTRHYLRAAAREAYARIHA